MLWQCVIFQIGNLRQQEVIQYDDESIIFQLKFAQRKRYSSKRYFPVLNFAPMSLLTQTPKLR
jgi:hypothetical protein